MARISARSNPTNLKEIDRKRVGITITEEEGKTFVRLDSINLDGLGLKNDLKLICIARAGQTSQRFELGTTQFWKKESYLLTDLDPSKPLRLRVLLRDADEFRLVASAEKLRPKGAGPSESLLPMEPADLGEELWRLDINEDDGPVLKYNSKIFPSATGAENYLPFCALVFPAALRCVLNEIAKESEGLSDEGSWMAAWLPWLQRSGAGLPTDDGKEQHEWCERAVAAFCERHRFASRLGLQLASGGDQ